MSREREIERDWEGWLAAEAAGDAAEAESRLGGLFAMLESPAPAAGFADRVLARAQSEARAAALRRQASRARAFGLMGRALAASLLAGAGIASAWVLPGVAALLGLVEWAALPGLAVRAFADLATLVARAFGDWQGLVEALRPIARALARPPVVAVLSGLVLVSSLALASLARTVERGKGVRHVASFG